MYKKLLIQVVRFYQNQILINLHLDKRQLLRKQHINKIINILTMIKKRIKKIKSPNHQNYSLWINLQRTSIIFSSSRHQCSITLTSSNVHRTCDLSASNLQSPISNIISFFLNQNLKYKNKNL